MNVPQLARRQGANLLTWLVGLIWFFPLLYMVLTSFKPETEVVPPSIIVANPTLENYRAVLKGSILSYFGNSMAITLGAVICSLTLGVPAAYAIVFGGMTPKKSDNLFFWFLSTTLLPPVSVIVPIFLLFRFGAMLDTLWGLILIHTGVNIPIVIWMTRSFLMDVPMEVLESADLDGASRWKSFFIIVLPLAKSGILATGLLVFVFVWNEFFFAVNLTYVKAAPVPVYMASFMTQEGLFWAKLSAISTTVALPPLILGWISQKSLVHGLTMGAVKG